MNNISITIISKHVYLYKSYRNTQERRNPYTTWCFCQNIWPIKSGMDL